MKGRAIVRASWAGTAAFGVTAALAATVRGTVAADGALVVAVALFLAGAAVFVASFARALARSRHDEVNLLGLYFLEGRTAPPAVRRLLLGSLVAEVAIALGTAARRPNTSVVFGILVPVYGLAMCGLWSARYGTFPRRRPARGVTRRPARRGGR